ncbi:MAG: T9SS type A sorting domain-containing protein, partial [Bacteroidales bacterium]
EVFIVNTLISNNSSSGIYNQTTEKGVGKWKIINSNITNNSSLDVKEGYGIDAFTLEAAELSIELINTILWGNQNTDLDISQSIIANAEYSDIGTVNTTSGAIYNEGTGIINTDPLFVNPAGIEYNLTAGSPCINTGIDVGLPYAGIAPDMGLIFLGSQVSDQIVEIHNFGANNTQYYIYNSPGLIFEFKAQNTMMVGTVEVKSILASPRAVTFHIEISIEDSLIAKWDQYVNDLTYKPYFHTKEVSYSLSEGDTIVYKINGAGSPAGGLSGINYVKLISAYIPSDDATIHSTVYGILGDEEITMVDPTVSVTSFLDGITVHDSATVLILDSSGGNAVSNPDMTDVVTGMVVKVTAEDGTTVEYAVSTDPTSISANHAESIVVYPIPAYDNIIIQTTISGEFTIKITSVNGQLLYSDKIEGPTHQIDLSSFQKGLYFITISSRDYVRTEKIIKL